MYNINNMKIFKHFLIFFLTFNSLVVYGGKKQKNKNNSSSSKPTKSLSVTTTNMNTLKSSIDDIKKSNLYNPEEIIVDDKLQLNNANFTEVSTKLQIVIDGSPDSTDVQSFLHDNKNFLSDLLDFMMVKMFNDDALDEAKITKNITDLSTLLDGTAFDTKDYIDDNFNANTIKNFFKIKILSKVEDKNDLKDFCTNFIKMKNQYVEIINEIKEIINLVDNKDSLIADVDQLNKFLIKFENLNEKMYSTTDINHNYDWEFLQKSTLITNCTNKTITDHFFKRFFNDGRLFAILYDIVNGLDLQWKLEYQERITLPSRLNIIDKIQEEQISIQYLLSLKKEFQTSLEALKTKYDAKNPDFNSHFKDPNAFMQLINDKKIAIEEWDFLKKLTSTLDITSLTFFTLKQADSDVITAAMGLKETIKDCLESQEVIKAATNEKKPLDTFETNIATLNGKLDLIKDSEQLINISDYNAQLTKWAEDFIEFFNEYLTLHEEFTNISAITLLYNPASDLKTTLEKFTDFQKTIESHPLFANGLLTIKDMESSITLDNFKTKIAMDNFVTVIEALDKQQKLDQNALTYKAEKQALKDVYTVATFPKKDDIIKKAFFTLTTTTQKNIENFYTQCDNLFKPEAPKPQTPPKPDTPHKPAPKKDDDTQQPKYDDTKVDDDTKADDDNQQDEKINNDNKNTQKSQDDFQKDDKNKKKTNESLSKESIDKNNKLRVAANSKIDEKKAKGFGSQLGFKEGSAALAVASVTGWGLKKYNDRQKNPMEQEYNMEQESQIQKNNKIKKSTRIKPSRNTTIDSN